MKQLFSANRSTSTYLLSVLLVLFCSITSMAKANTTEPLSPQWKKCWGKGKWYGGCLSIKVSWSISSNSESKTDMQSLVDKIDVQLNEAQDGLIFTFPPN
jgi:hypothetical protein